jgi:hypothetical protein
MSNRHAGARAAGSAAGSAGERAAPALTEP